jgi:hypothetical protein
MDDTPGNRQFRDLICDLVGPLGAYISVLRDIQKTFDLDTAVGEQLDFVGNVIGLKRQGFPDARYRTFLKIQRDLILGAHRNEANWTGTSNNILTICRTFIGVGGDITLVNYGTYSLSLSIPSISDPNEFNILFDFLCKALYAGVLGQVIRPIGDDSLWASDHPAVVIPGGGIWCSAHPAVVIPDCATWGTARSFGDCPVPA